MSGHSKWSTIKHQKESTDQKKGLLFTKLAKSISLAVRSGGGITDIDSNYHLRLAVENAKKSNMPKNNILRAIEKGKGSNSSSNNLFICEGYGPGSIALLILCDGENRSEMISRLNNLLIKTGGRLGELGSVSYLFSHYFRLNLSAYLHSYDDLLRTALDSEADDCEIEKESFYLLVKPKNLNKINTNLINLNINISSSEEYYKPFTKIKIDNKDIYRKVLDLLNNLKSIEGVISVYTNLDSYLIQ